MATMTKDDLNRAVAHRDTKCALTGAPVAKDEECFWVPGVGLIRGDLDPDEILTKLANFTATVPTSPNPLRPPTTPSVSYEAMCENLAQEFEAALDELTRRGTDADFDTEALKLYRDLHPRQDS